MIERITRDEMLMEVAHVVAKRGTCSRLQVGAVVAKEGRILVTGYNGAARGMPHCTHESYSPTKDLVIPPWAEEVVGTTFHELNTLYYDGVSVDTSPGCTIAQHAERNAIDFAAREGIKLEGASVYITHAPCEACARSLLGVGVGEVFFTTRYRKTEGIDLLVRSGIPVFDMGDNLR